MNTDFEVGKYYKLRDDYPKPADDGNIVFEGRANFWLPEMLVLFDHQPRKCVVRKGGRVNFEGLTNGPWYFPPEDFIEVEHPK